MKCRCCERDMGEFAAVMRFFAPASFDNICGTCDMDFRRAINQHAEMLIETTRRMQCERMGIPTVAEEKTPRGPAEPGPCGGTQQVKSGGVG